MLRSLSLKASLASLVVACALSAALAQTGPGSPPPAPGKAGAPYMTPARLEKLLRGAGHSVQVRSFPNGGKTVVATIVRDGWRFVVECEFNSASSNLNVVCPLGNPVSTISATQLQQLLTANYTLPGALRFSYRVSDQRLCLEAPNFATSNMTDTALRNILQCVTQTARNTHKLWDTNHGPVS